MGRTKVALATARMIGTDHEYLWRDTLLIEHVAGNREKVAEIIKILTNDDVDLTDETEEAIEQIRKAG